MSTGGDDDGDLPCSRSFVTKTLICASNESLACSFSNAGRAIAHVWNDMKNSMNILLNSVKVVLSISSTYIYLRRSQLSSDDYMRMDSRSR